MKAKEKKVYVYQGIVMLMACLAMVMFFGKVVFGKIESNQFGTYTTYANLKIQKIWDDVDESDIPETISVEFKFLEYNDEYDPASPSAADKYITKTEEVILSEDNDWTEEISGYGDKYAKYIKIKSFKEEEIDGFKCSSISESEISDNTYYVEITNTKIETEPTEPEESESKPTESEPTTPEESEPEPTEPTEPTDPTDPSEPHKPGGGGNSGGGGGGGSSSGGGGGTPGKPVTPVTPQTQEPQTPDETPGDVPPAPWYKLPVMGDEQFGPGFVNDSSNQVALPEVQTETESIIPQLQELYAQNSELVGWLTVPGTGFGYPVMLSQNDPFYYQHHTFEKQLDEVGIPFIGPYCKQDSMNVLIHGHNMRDVSQFGYIWNYQDPNFRQQNPTIDFKTLTDENGSYEVMAVFFAPEYAEGTENVFWWYRYIGDMNKNQFDYYVQNAKALSLYDTGVTAEYGDKLITLETCASSKDSTRLVVVARKKAAHTATVTQ